MTRMIEELRIRVDAPREAVWQALYGDLAESGPHVEVLRADAPDELAILARTAPGERMTLSYTLSTEGDVTIVAASIAVEGPLYAAKKILSFGSADRGYLRMLAVGLDNLRGHFGATPEDE